ncbi:hypothetical protein ACFL3S_10955 [Gemmatimonadota bacterium]
MSIHSADQDTLREEANRLYWESDESVNQIGEELALSKGVLYGLIDPLPAGLPCPKCGEEMTFPNRTARDRGFLACSACGMEEEEDAVQAFWEGAAEGPEGTSTLDPRTVAKRAGHAFQKAMSSGKTRVSSLSPRGRVLAGTAILGVAAGLLIGTYMKKR